MAAILLVSGLAAQSELRTAHPELLGFAITFDLTLTAAACHWLLGVRRGGLPAWTIVPLLLLGLAVSRVLVPDTFETTSRVSILVLAIVEGTLLTFAVLRVRTIFRGYRAARLAGAEHFDALEAGWLALAPAWPRLTAWVRLEIQVWTLFVFGWWFERRPADGPLVFTHHKRSGWFVVMGVLTFLVVSEGALIHLWLDSAGHSIAKWVSFAVHAYSVLWLIGDAQGLRVYRTSISRTRGELTLEVRVGLRGHARIPVSNLAEVVTGSWEKAGPDEVLLTLHGAANVRLAFVEPNSVKSMFGPETRVCALLLQVDEPDAFARACAT